MAKVARLIPPWTPRRVLAVCVLGALALLLYVRVDPRLRAGLFWFRGPAELTMPVAGLSPSHVHSTWHDARPGGRRHEGVDLFAPKGTAILSAADGFVWAIGRNELGGNAISIVGEGWTVYYYAHLDAWAANLLPGDRVHAGDVLGGVGNTGDARGLPPHLHFGMTRLSFLGNRNVDPAPLLAGSRVLPSQLLVGGVHDPPAAALHAGGREDLAMPDAN